MNTPKIEHAPGRSMVHRMLLALSLTAVLLAGMLVPGPFGPAKANAAEGPNPNDCTTVVCDIVNRWKPYEAGLKGKLLFSADGTFQIDEYGDRTSCRIPGDLNSYSFAGYLRYLKAAPCDGQDKRQKWYLTPSATAGHYMIRSLSDQATNECISQRSSHWIMPGEVEMRDCDPTNDNQWSIETQSPDHSYDARWTRLDQSMTNRAATYGMTKCGDTPTSCKFTGSSSTYSTGNPICVLNYRNDSDVAAPAQSYTVTESTANAHMTGDTTTSGVTSGVTVKLGFGDVETTFSSSFTQTWAKTSSDTRTNTSTGGTTHSTPPVPPQSYAWLTATPVTKSYTGSFVFNPGSRDEWSYADGSTITAPVPTNGTGGKTSITAGVASDSDPQNECGGIQNTFTG